MRVIFRGAPLDLDDKLLLGEGGEARVYTHPHAHNLAFKVFHDVKSALHALRVEKLRAFPASLPPQVIAPRELLLDGSGAIVGYAMARVRDAIDIARLAQRTRLGVIDNTRVLQIMIALRETVARVHACNVVVGDLNDGNVLLEDRGAGAPFLIDADSMQLAHLPCPVAHERFLDPKLYGRELSKTPQFDESTDAYALRVLLTQSLLFVHPYGGVHPKHKTLLRRAEAQWSILRGDVALPKSALPFEILPDDLLDDLARCFDRGQRATLDPRLLDVRFRSCSCGIEHARTSCPVCKTAVQKPAIRAHRGITVETIAETRGSVVQARMLDGHLALLIEENGRVRRESHETVLEGPRAEGLRFEMAGKRTWVGLDGDLVAIERGAVVERARTATCRGAPAFAAGREGLFVIEGDVLLHHESQTRIGRIFEGQTTISSGDDGGIAWFRAGNKLVAYAFSRSSFADVILPQPAGRLLDLQVTFGGDRALVGIASDDNGVRKHALHLIDARGRCIASIEGRPDDSPLLHAIRGHCVVGSQALAPTREGVMAIRIDRGRLVEGALFADTQPFVDETVELLPGPAGSLVVVQPQAVTKLRLT